MRTETRRWTVVAVVLVLAAGAGVAWNEFDARADRFARARMAVGGDPVRGAQAIAARGCASCHDIPGIRPGGAQVGPSLEGLATRPFLAEFRTIGLTKNLLGSSDCCAASHHCSTRMHLTPAAG